MTEFSGIRVNYYQGRPQGLQLIIPVDNEFELPPGYAFRNLIPVHMLPNSAHADEISYPILPDHDATGIVLEIDIVEGLGELYYQTLKKLMGVVFTDWMIRWDTSKGCYLFQDTPWETTTLRSTLIVRAINKIREDAKV